MTAPTMTHRIMRQTVEVHTMEHLNRDGTPRMVDVTTHRISCACGRVFATGSDMLTLARYLGHLPQPKRGER